MKKRLHCLAAVLLPAALLLAFASGCNKSTEETQEETREGLDIGYAMEGVTFVDDPDALQKQVDAMYDSMNNPTLTLEYRNTASSSNGIDFTCYIANAAENQLDLFFEIYGDAAMNDELFSSGLLRPGSAIREITLNHAINPGSSSAILVFNQVQEEDGVMSIAETRSVALTMNVTQS